MLVPLQPLLLSFYFLSLLWSLESLLLCYCGEDTGIVLLWHSLDIPCELFVFICRGPATRQTTSRAPSTKVRYTAPAKNGDNSSRREISKAVGKICKSPCFTYL